MSAAAAAAVAPAAAEHSYYIYHSPLLPFAFLDYREVKCSDVTEI